MTDNKTHRPCLTCTRVLFPDKCDNKNCREWREWFLKRWEETRKTLQRRMKQ